MKRDRDISISILQIIFAVSAIFINDHTFAAISPRSQVVSKALDCFKSQGLSGGLSEKDVCYSGESNESDARNSLVENALNQTEGTLKGQELPQDEPAQEISSPQDTKEKETEIRVEKTGRETSSSKDSSSHRLEIGTSGSRIEYKEPGYMRDKGEMTSLFSRYTYRTSDNRHIKSIEDVFKDEEVANVYQVEANFGWGYVDYDSNGTGSLDDVRDFLFEVRGMTGYDFFLNQRTRLTPFIGFGYRYLNDDSGGRQTSTGHFGYERESRYYYIPIGGELNRQFGMGLEVSLNAEFDVFIFGHQKSHLEDVNANFNTVGNDQNSGYGLRGSVRLLKENEKIDLYIEPFIRYWAIDDSDASKVTYAGAPVGAGLEPENNSTEIGAIIGAIF